jgi:hypothetical protein
MLPKTDEFPDVPLAVYVGAPAPPPPTVTVIGEPALTTYPVAVEYPPAPPPPPKEPPPPPPATTRYSTVGVTIGTGIGILAVLKLRIEYLFNVILLIIFTEFLMLRLVQ